MHRDPPADTRALPYPQQRRAGVAVRTGTAQGRRSQANGCSSSTANRLNAASERRIATGSIPRTMKKTRRELRSGVGQRSRWNGGRTRCCTPLTQTGVDESTTFRMPLT